MTQRVNPSRDRTATSFETGGAIAFGGHGADGFVVPAGTPTDLATQDGNVDETQMNAFAESHSASSFDVTIDPGEAFIFGSWVAKDATTTVTLASSTTGQTVYVGYDKDVGADTVIIGTSSAFSDTAGDTDPRIPIWDFDTDGSGVTASTGRRLIGYSEEVVGKSFYGNKDFSIFYNESQDTLQIRDEVNDVVKMEFDKSDDVIVPVGDILDGSNNVIYSQTNNHIPQGRLENASVTVAGNTVSLGGSTNINYADISGIFDESDNTVIIETRTSDPTSPSDGRIWVRTDL